MEKYFVAAMSGAQWLGNGSILRLLEYFGNNAQRAWHASITELKKARLTQRTIESFVAFRKKNPDAPERLADYCDRKHFGLCSYVDEDYPPLLKEISSPPVFFYYRGKLQPFVERVGIVGTRNNTDYGKKVALEFAEQLAAVGLTVVSGAARGIDTFAHRGALKTGRTVAVLGYGLNWVFPSENKKLLEEIAENGLVMSEFHPNVKATALTFPQRNRIIAGLCRSVVVVEAGKKSGALITAELALENNRDVFCVPGKLDSTTSSGCNDWIHEGATLVRNVKDVLDHCRFDSEKISVQNLPETNLFEQSLFAQKNLPKQILFERMLSEKSFSVRKPPEQKNLSAPKKLSVPKTPPVALDGLNAKIFEIIPADGFVTDDDILNKIDDVEPYELPQILLELELKNCIVENAGRYTRK